jgi:hypothetical protein
MDYLKAIYPKELTPAIPFARTPLFDFNLPQ